MLMIYLSMLDTEEDKNILMELHDEYSQIMYRVANGILKDNSLAEDVVQEGFIKIIKNFENVIKKKCPQTKSYFIKIARATSIDVYRERKNKQTISFDEYEGTIADDFDDIDDLLDGMEIEKSLFKLPKPYYIILSLKYDEGYTYKEIARILDITEENVKKRLLRARTRFKEILKEQEVKI